MNLPATNFASINHTNAFHILNAQNQLRVARAGCSVGNMVVIHLMFADDICVFSPSISGLQSLLNICECAVEHDIAFICNKTISAFFAPKNMNNLPHQMFF